MTEIEETLAGGEAATETEGGAPAPPSPATPSVDPQQYAAMAQRVEQMERFIQENFAGSDEPEEDLDGMDVGQLMARYVDTRFEGIAPFVQAAAQEQGDKRFNALMDELEKKPDIGKVDRKLAYMVAESMLAEVGDPIKAVEEGARYAASVLKAEREAGINDYKKSVGRRTPDDFGVESGERSSPPAKSYEEVIERWSSQNEVT